MPKTLRLICIWAAMVAVIFATKPHTASAFQTDAQKELHAKQVLIRGLTQMRTGFPDQAAAFYAEGLKVNPDNATLLSSMADAQAAMGDFSLASFYLEKAIGQLPDDVYLNQQALFVSMEAGNATEAIRYSSKLVSLNPMDLNTHISNLVLLSRLNQGSLAVASAELGVEAFPDNEEMLRTALEVFVNAGALTPAKAVATSISELSNDPDDLFELARILVQNGELEAARQQLRLILLSDPGFIEAEETLISLSQTDPSVDSGLPTSWKPSSEASRPAISELTDDAAGSLSTIERLFAEGNHEAVVSLARDQIQSDPRQLQHWVFAMRSLIELNMLNDALTLAEDGGLLFPGYAPLMFQHARALKLAERPAEATDLATKALLNAESESELFKQIQAFLSQFN